MRFLVVIGQGRHGGLTTKFPIARLNLEVMLQSNVSSGINKKRWNDNISGPVLLTEAYFRK